MALRWVFVGAMAGATVFGLFLAWGMVHVAVGWEKERLERR